MNKWQEADMICILTNAFFPVTPEKISIKINGNNKTVNLINEGEINILKKSRVDRH